MNSIVHRRLWLCVLAVLLASGLALAMVPKAALAAPPTHLKGFFEEDFVITDVCAFPVRLEAAGKYRLMFLNNPRAPFDVFEVLPPAPVTLTNLDEPTNDLTVRGAARPPHGTENLGPGGGDLVVETGRFFVLDPGFGLFLFQGRATYIVDEGGNFTLLSTKGRMTDLCALLS